MKTIGSVLKRLLLALGGSASENYLNNITLIDRIAALAENGQIPSSVVQGGGGIQTPVSIEDGGTSATTATEACANLKAFDLGVAANAIASGDNLDNYKTVGIYLCTPSSIAANLYQNGNCPTQRAFKMIVMNTISSAYLLQIIYDYRGEAMWQRWYRSSWSAWYKYSSNVVTSTSFSTTYGGVTTSTGCWLDKIGNTVQCRINHGDGTTFSGLTGIDAICTIPNDYRPTDTVVGTMLARDNGTWGIANYVPVALRVTSSGGVQIRQNKDVLQTMKYITGCITWVSE